MFVRQHPLYTPILMCCMHSARLIFIFFHSTRYTFYSVIFSPVLKPVQRTLSFVICLYNISLVLRNKSRKNTNVRLSKVTMQMQTVAVHRWTLDSPRCRFEPAFIYIYIFQRRRRRAAKPVELPLSWTGSRNFSMFSSRIYRRYPILYHHMLMLLAATWKWLIFLLSQQLIFGRRCRRVPNKNKTKHI